MIRRDDIVRFLELAEKDKAPEGKQWIVHLTVTEKKGYFRGGDTTFDCPLYAIREGKVELPISSLAEVVGWGWYRPKSKNEEMGKTEWAEMTCVDGRISYGKRRCNNDRITFAFGPGEYEHYPTQAEIIVLGRLLDQDITDRIGLNSRIPGALAKLETEIASTLRGLERYGVTEDDIRDVVEKAFKRTEPVIAASSFYQACKRSMI
jgi:hypothetical protein